jgi:hypothetical protein
MYEKHELSIEYLNLSFYGHYSIGCHWMQVDQLDAGLY